MLDHHFETLKVFFRIVVSLDEDVIELILEQNNSNSITYKITPGAFTIKDISVTVYTMGDH